MARIAPFPISDHCDGWRFFNPAGQPQAGNFSALPKWWYQQVILGRRTPWPKKVPPPAAPRLPLSLSRGEMAATFIGHATFLLQLPGLNILTDPVFLERASPFQWVGPRRVRPPALSLAELPPIHLVLVSHNHYDHLDLPSLRRLARKDRPLIITTLGNKIWLEKRGVPNVVELDWWQTQQMAPDFEVVCTPAQHFAARWPWDRCKTLWGGFALKTSSGRIYFTGDSAYSETFSQIGNRLGPFDLALLPIGAYEPRWFLAAMHMNPQEAVRVHQAVHSRLSIAMHFGTFQLTDEGIDAPLSALVEARINAALSADDFIALNFGETRLIQAGELR